MPTGYTDLLDSDPDLTTEKWLTVHLVRAFGICYPIRDDGGYQTAEQIEDKITKYYKSDLEDSNERLTEARNVLKELLNYSSDDWNRIYSIEIENISKYNIGSINSAKTIFKRHSKIVDDLNKIRSHTSDKFILDIVSFGLNQLKLVEDETKPFIHETPNFVDFKEKKIKNAERMIEFRKDDVEKAKEMLKFVGKYREFVDVVHDVLKEK